MAQKTMILPELHYQSVYDPVTPPLVRALSAPNVPTSNSLSSPHHDGSGVDDDEETSAAPITLLKQKAVQNLGQAISEPITATTLNKLASAITESFHTDYYQKEVAKLEKMINRLHKFEIATGLVGDIARTVELIAPAGAVLGMISKFFGYVKSVKTIMLEALGLVRSSVETTISIQDCLVTIEFKVPLAMIRCIINFYEILEECTTTMSGIVERTSLFKETLHRNKYRDMVKYMQAKLGDTKSDFIQCGILINCSYSYKQSSIFSDNTSDVNEESDDFILTSALMNALQLNNDNLSDYLGLNQLTIQEMISLRAILQARRTPAQASSSTTRLASPADQRSTASPRAESTQQSATHQIFMVLGIKYDKADSPGLNGNVTEDDVEENSRPPGGHAKYAEGPANHGYKIPLDSAGNLYDLRNQLFDRVIEILSQRISTESETASGNAFWVHTLRKDQHLRFGKGHTWVQQFVSRD
ncbi:hypothetical protein V865_005343 [Kwoniella europaea PYCC6329]|uniref:Fungal STAND N-terminal Goodbye domain-containing protein n=1 Tax=Kwoniella europaea PYCC6329 TaxID=1423913 RepID=A0AAX4KLE3_9TREE